MTRIRIGSFILVLLSVNMGSARKAASDSSSLNPLQPLSHLGRKLTSGICNILSDGSPQSSYKTIRFDFRSQCLQKAKRLGVVRVIPVFLEFQYYFFSGNTLKNYFRSIVDLDFRNPGFCYYYPLQSIRSTTYHTFPLESIRETLPYCHTAARRIIACIRMAYFKHWRLSTPTRLTKHTRAPIISKFIANNLKESKNNKKALFKALRSMKFDNVKIWLDEIGFLALDRNGRAGGILEGRLKIRHTWQGKKVRPFLLLTLTRLRTRGF